MIKAEVGKIIGNYTLVSLKGRGATAEVWSAVDDKDNIVALKIFNPSVIIDEKKVKEIKKEFENTRHLDSDHILIPSEIIELEGMPVLVMPLANRSVWLEYLKRCTQTDANEAVKTVDLTENMVTHEDNLFTEVELLEMINHISKAIKCIDDNGKIHDDIKPGNFLIVQKGESIKYLLSDFGIAKDIRSEVLRQTANVNNTFTVAYASPERHSTYKPSTSGDIFSLGASIFDLTNNIKTAPGILLNRNENIPAVVGDYSKGFKSLVNGMMDPNPETRIEIETLIEKSNELLSVENQSINVSQEVASPVYDQRETITVPYKADNYQPIQATTVKKKKFPVLLISLCSIMIAMGAWYYMAGGSSYDRVLPHNAYGCACVSDNSMAGIIDVEENIIMDIKYKNCKYLDSRNIKLITTTNEELIFDSATKTIK